MQENLTGTAVVRAYSMEAREIRAFERLNRDFHEKLRQGFRQIAADNPGRCVMVDASGDPQTVHSVVLARVNERLGMALPPLSGGLSGSGASGKSV